MPGSGGVSDALGAADGRNKGLGFVKLVGVLALPPSLLTILCLCFWVSGCGRVGGGMKSLTLISAGHGEERKPKYHDQSKESGSTT